MNYKTTLALVLLLAAVGAYFYFVEFGTTSRYDAHQQQQADQTDAVEGEPLFDEMDADTISSITLTRAGQSMTATRTNGDWHQTAPVRFPLNNYTLDSIAKQLASLRYLKKISADMPDAPSDSLMGLESARAVVNFTAGDKATTLHLGKVTLGGHAYLKVEGDENAYVVKTTLHGALLDEPVTTWRRNALELPAASAAQSALIEPAETDPITLRKIEDRWHFGPQTRQRVSQETVESWFASLARVSVTGFVEDAPDTPGLYGLTQPSLRIHATRLDADGEKVTQVLHIGNADLEGGNHYAALTTGDEPISVVFSISSEDTEALATTQTDLRDPKVIDADALLVRGLVVEQDGKTTLNLIRSPAAGYSFGDPAPSFEPDYVACHEMLTGVCGLESARFVEEVSTLGTPSASVRMLFAGDKTLSFKIYSQGDDVAIISGEESIAYLAPSEAVETLLGPTIGLRERTVVEIAPDQLDRVRLQRDDGVTFEFVAEGVSDEVDVNAWAWRLDGHGSRFEAESFDQLLSSFDPLKVESWLTDPIEPMAGWLELSITPSNGTPFTLRTEPVSGASLMSGVDSAFIVPQSVVDQLRAEYRPRTVLDIEMNKISSVVLSSDKTSVTLGRDGQLYTIDTGEVDQAVAAAVFDTLAGLRADRYTNPLHLMPEAIDFTIQITTSDGETITLRALHAMEGSKTVLLTLDGPRGEDYRGWFTLNEETVAQLRAPLTEVETPIK